MDTRVLLGDKQRTGDSFFFCELTEPGANCNPGRSSNKHLWHQAAWPRPMAVLLMTDTLEVFTRAVSLPFIQPEKCDTMICHILAYCHNFFLLSIMLCNLVILRFVPSHSGYLSCGCGNSSIV